MDPRLCRDQLEQLIASEVTLLNELEKLLVTEHDVLLKNELVALEAASDARQQCMGALLQIQDERVALLRMHGYSNDPAGINRLLDWCDPAKILKSRWSACLELASRCRQSNERNAALVAARMKRVAGLLDVIVGPAQRATVYSASGSRDSGRSGALFAAEA